MTDFSMLAFHLTYAATTGVTFVMLLGQFLAFIILLALAARARVLVRAGLSLIRGIH